MPRRINIEPGTRFGDWTFIREAERSGTQRRLWCTCVCGTERAVQITGLRNGTSSSCGCRMRGDAEFGRQGRETLIQRKREKAQVTDLGRKCLTCDEWKPWAKFPLMDSHSTGRSSNCVDCRRHRQVKRQYGITREEYKSLLNGQRGLCGICEEPEGPGRSGGFCIDHDHSCCTRDETVPSRGIGCRNCIRGLLCGNCNVMLGYAEKRTKVSTLFAEYLARRPLAHLAAETA